MNDIEVTFPGPCSEPWDSMTASGCNRHCSVCDRVVHDLTQMDADEAIRIMEQGECVRATIGSDRVVTSRTGSSRKLVAAVAAPLTFAVAACSTTGGPAVTPLYELSGKTDSIYGGKVVLTDTAGRTRNTAISRDRTFRFRNLRANTYSITIEPYCGDRVTIENVSVHDSDVTIGPVEIEGQCIIIGKIQPKNPLRNG